MAGASSLLPPAQACGYPSVGGPLSVPPNYPSAVGSRSSELSSMLQRRNGAAESSCRLPTHQTATIVTQPLTPIGLMGWHQMPRSAFARWIRRC
jgi:hypothetical protein